MEDTLITFETAKLAKEKGFRESVLDAFEKDGARSKERTLEGGYYDYNYNGSESYSAPTQSVLQKWLREKYSIDIGIVKEVNKYLMIVYNIIMSDSCNASPYRDLINLEVNCDTYEEALEFALEKGLTLIDINLIIDNEG